MSATQGAVPFGAWPSPISAERVSTGGVGLDAICHIGPSVWWAELRPSEGGRVVLVRCDRAGATVDALPAPFSARTRVHEYGGGAWFAGPDAVYFSNWGDQRLHRLEFDEHGAPVDGAEPHPITPEPETASAWRYADGRVTPDGDWIVAVREDHSPAVVEAHGEAANTLVALPADGSAAPKVIFSGTDFVAAPRISPDGRWVSWITWNHPDMPWDATRLCAAPLWLHGDELRLGNTQVVAGGDEVSVVSADWTADGRLVFASDETGWWNLRSWRPGSDEVTSLTELVGAEIGFPQWVFGLQSWVEVGDQLAVVITRDGADELALLDAEGTITGLDAGGALDGVSWVQSMAGGRGFLDVIVHHADRLPSIVQIDLTAEAPGSTGHAHPTTVLRAPNDLGVEAAWFSRAEAITFGGTGAAPGDDPSAHAFFYPPTGAGCAAPDGELPPLVVMGHGGPTAHSAPSLSLKVQYWTSRGFAVVDVNYGGSSGFGRAYRNRLRDAWGVVDVADCIAAARSLAEAGRVDPDRIVIRGGSAGGFTVLRALQESDLFAAGTSLYGVADLTALAEETHKFESRYLDRLIGPYPEAEEIYRERAPLSHTDDLSSPLLVLQGSEDEIVPPSQSEAIVAAVAAKGLPHAYVLYEGEQHGFRQASTIVASLEAELWFYGRVLGFEPADELVAVPGAVGL